MSENQTPDPAQPVTPATPPTTPTPPPVPATLSNWETRREERWQQKQERREERAEYRRMRGGWGGEWVGGAILITLGVVFLLQNMGWYVGNWWAIFLLLPGLGALGSAWSLYRNTGQFNGPARGALFGGLLLTMLAVIFFFDLSWGLFGPLILILIGAGILISGFWK